MSGRVDTLRQELRGSQSREGQAQDTIRELERELSDGKSEVCDLKASLERSERRLREQQKALEEARQTEQRLAQEVGFLRSYHIIVRLHCKYINAGNIF